MRRLVLVSSLATIGLAIAEPGSAQYSYPPGANRGDAIDSQALPPLTGRGTYPYDVHPRAEEPAEALPPPPDRGYETGAPAYRPGYGAPPPGVYAAPTPGTYAPPPPGAAYGTPPAYGAQPSYGTQPAPYGTQPAPAYGANPHHIYTPGTSPYIARQDDPNAPRPPMSIEPGRAPMPGTTGSVPPATIAALPPEDQPEVGKPKELPPQFKRQIVDYQTKHPAGTIIIDTPSTFLYYVNGDGTAIRYGIGVGREGFTWAGVEKITRMAEWPDWHPPAEMIERQPYLPRFMAGGESNPMGARALYLGKTVYRVHGTNQPSTIGQFVSSGCIRMLNEDVIDLYSRVKVGTKVVVLGDGKGPGATASR
jgi:lipoprotein-anchoring transpeptidase ErfK/SrfK